MTRASKSTKVVVKFLPVPNRPLATMSVMPSPPWFRLPKNCYLHMVVNPSHVQDPDDDHEPADRTVTALRLDTDHSTMDGYDKCDDVSDIEYDDGNDSYKSGRTGGSEAAPYNRRPTTSTFNFKRSFMDLSSPRHDSPPPRSHNIALPLPPPAASDGGDSSDDDRQPSSPTWRRKPEEKPFVSSREDGSWRQATLSKRRRVEEVTPSSERRYGRDEEPSAQEDDHKTVIDIDEEVDRERWKHRLRTAGENGLFEVPKNLDEIPLSQLRRIYATNRRCVQVDTLVKYYSAALLVSFVATDILSENVIGVDMDKYVDLQVQQMHIYRHHIRRIAERQVAAARNNGLFSESQNPMVSIIVTFVLTTVSFFAIRLFTRNKSSMLIGFLTRLMGTPVQGPQQPNTPAPSFSPMTMIASMFGGGADQPQNRMPRPSDVL